MKTSEEYLNVALDFNLNISTLKLKFWTEIMAEYAEYYHQEKLKEGQVMPTDEEIEKVFEHYHPARDEDEKKICMKVVKWFKSQIKTVDLREELIEFCIYNVKTGTPNDILRSDAKHWVDEYLKTR